MPSLYDTSTSASSTGSRSSGFFPKSHPKPESSYSNQYSLASAAKNASFRERVAHSELGLAEIREHDIASSRPSSIGHRQQHSYAASEPGIARSSFADSARFKGYFTRNVATEQKHSSERDGVREGDFQRKHMQQSTEQHPRGRSPDGYRSTSGIINSQYLKSTERSRSLSSNRFSGNNLRMEPTSSNRLETSKESQQRATYRSSSPPPRRNSQAEDRQFGDRSSLTMGSSKEEEEANNTRDSAESPPPNAAKLTHYGRAEIETPTPTSVRDLKQRLWDSDETLHHWHAQNERLQKSHIEPRRLGYSVSSKSSNSSQLETFTESLTTISSTRRTLTRSISPRPVRSREPAGHSLLLNSRYSQAAARVASRSPSRRKFAAQSTSPTRTNLFVESVQSELQPRDLASPQTNSTDVHNEPQARPQAPAANGTKAESEVTAVMTNKAIASLMARISAVKRSDPAEALAQIDAILSSENASLETLREETGLTRHGDVSAVDEKEVSATQPLHVAQEAMIGHIDEESSIAATSVSSMTNPTYQGPSTVRNEVLSFSNKPSLLQAYGSTALIGRKERYRSMSEQRKSAAPPSTISLSSKDKVRFGESVRQRPSEFPPIMPSNSAELADKIRRWDEMSAPEITGVTSEDSRYPIEPEGRSFTTTVTSRRRAHPWDSSMSGQVGGKTAPGENVSRSSSWMKTYKPKYNSQENVAQFPTDCYFDEESNSIQAFPSEYSDDKSETDQKSDNIATGEVIQTTTKQQETPKTIQFDSTWVSLPESSFFRDVAAPTHTVREIATTPPRLGGSSFNHDDALASPNYAFRLQRAPRQPDVSSPSPPSRLVRSEEENQRRMQTFSPQTRQPARDFHSLSPRAIRIDRDLRRTNSGDDSSTEYGEEVTLLNKPKSRGLRSFLPKRRTFKRSTLAPLDEDTSLLSHKSDMLALDVELPPPAQNRGRRLALTQDRVRSRSLDDSRSRNPSIAEKFGRLLRV
ncbi:hypothetical protein FisN_25Hh177 [Fistulifera solaris]|uniref:Uncharacterized protein n=1 Tax=Fistulifera solaris TaxID=1519565 RepID=A0A1Z5JVY1_FISSO|nr:hypothetical protein FisN_25Hh177 [Fistulifera solaris]|eukprot:GAX18193.1 hypothetical protein FisN_25Hh177 [Fistulifera solaris]